MATAKKLRSGNWRIQVFLGRDSNGKSIRVSFTGPTKREVELQAAKYAAENPRITDSRDITVKVAVEKYIVAKSPVLSPATIRAYRSYQRNHFDDIADVRIFRLTSYDMQMFISSLSGKVGPKTTANVYGLLASSVTLFRPDAIFRVTLPRRKKERQESPSDAVVMDLFSKADPELQKCIALAAFGSLRRGEICALKHKDINGPTIYVHADMVMDENGNWVYKDIPKTSDSNRKIHMPEQVVELLGDGIDDEYVVGINPGRVTDRFIKLRERLGYDVRFHDMRHYYASIGAVLGVPDSYLSSFGGWRSDNPGIMKTVYQNVISVESAKYSTIMNEHFNRLISTHMSTHNEAEMQ